MDWDIFKKKDVNEIRVSYNVVPQYYRVLEYMIQKNLLIEMLKEQGREYIPKIHSKIMFKLLFDMIYQYDHPVIDNNMFTKPMIDRYHQTIIRCNKSSLGTGFHAFEIILVNFMYIQTYIIYDEAKQDTEFHVAKTMEIINNCLTSIINKEPPFDKWIKEYEAAYAYFLNDESYDTEEYEVFTKMFLRLNNRLFTKKPIYFSDELEVYLKKKYGDNKVEEDIDDYLIDSTYDDADTESYDDDDIYDF